MSYSINEQYLKNKLVYKDKISLYFLCDLSNKRTELFQTFSTICHIDLLNDCVKQNDITRVRFINCDKNFIDSFKSKIDLPIEEGLKRAKARQSLDRFENEER